MINRELIRLKSVQVLYAFYENEGKDVLTAEKELFFSLDKSYEMYQHLLLLMVGLNHIALRVAETLQARARRLGLEADVNQKLINNRFLVQLEQNEQLLAFRDAQKFSWLDHEDFLRRLYAQLQEQNFFQDYLHSSEDSYDEDRELWRKIYRNMLCNNDALDEILEETSLYWNDDKVIVDTFILKTINRFKESNAARQPLLPKFKSEEDRTFASTLFTNAIRNADYYRELISNQSHGWELTRLAHMDLVIMQLALSEIICCESIPVNVSISEYVEIARTYSTPRSAGYINGILDAIVKQLRADGKINK